MLAADIVEFAKAKGIVTGLGVQPLFDRLVIKNNPPDPCNLLLSYGLGISKIDPIRFGLYLETVLLDDRPLRIRIDVDDRHAVEIRRHFGLTASFVSVADSRGFRCAIHGLRDSLLAGRCQEARTV